MNGFARLVVDAGTLVSADLMRPNDPRDLDFLSEGPVVPAAWQAYFGTRCYFGSKRPANFLRSSTCQVRGICLASRLKAGLPGW